MSTRATYGPRIGARLIVNLVGGEALDGILTTMTDDALELQRGTVHVSTAGEKSPMLGAGVIVPVDRIFFVQVVDQ